MIESRFQQFNYEILSKAFRNSCVPLLCQIPSQEIFYSLSKIYGLFGHYLKEK